MGIVWRKNQLPKAPVAGRCEKIGQVDVILSQTAERDPGVPKVAWARKNVWGA